MKTLEQDYSEITDINNESITATYDEGTSEEANLFISKINKIATDLNIEVEISVSDDMSESDETAWTIVDVSFSHLSANVETIRTLLDRIGG